MSDVYKGQEEPVWFARSIYELGAIKVLIRGVWDGHGRNYYFLNGEKVSKKKYDGDKPKKPRVSVKARLISTWSVGDIYESTGLVLETSDGTRLYHVGKGQLVDAFYDFDKGEFNTTIDVEFSASLERGELDGEYVSYAKRPSKIVFKKEKSDGLDIDNLLGLWKVTSNEGEEAQDDVYWYFEENKFTHYWRGNRIGPKIFHIRGNRIAFVDDEITVSSLERNKMTANWNWVCDLEKSDDKVEVSESDSKQNFTMPP